MNHFCEEGRTLDFMNQKMMTIYGLYFLILCTIQTEAKDLGKYGRRGFIQSELSKIRCDVHDFVNTYDNEVKKSPFHNRTVAQITQSWQSTFPDGNYQTNTKNTVPYSQMGPRDPDTILRMAEYQAMVYCKSDGLTSPPNISSIINMAQKNLRVGNFTIEATGFDEKHYLFWYIASNIAQRSIILVHRGTSKENPDDVYDDLSHFKIHNFLGILNLNFPFLSKSKDVAVEIGFYERFQHQKTPIVSAVRNVLNRYTNPSFSFIVVGHSLGAAWAFLNAGYFSTLNDINQRMTAIYTFGQPLLGSPLFVNEVTAKLNSPSVRYVRVVNRNDVVPHLGCKDCIQPEYANEKWVVYAPNTDAVQWKDCQGGEDLTCSSGLPCKILSWANHSAVGKFSMRSEFCRIASNT